jgi:hypothetical protein
MTSDYDKLQLNNGLALTPQMGWVIAPHLVRFLFRSAPNFPTAVAGSASRALMLGDYG